jgi:two-component system, OmpR family, aerobic respiration control sensor histidine kinase ArcB
MEKNMTQILSVEDNTIIAIVITHFVTKHGCQIQVAPNATTGLAMSKEKRFDLILMDIGLPDGSGDQVALQIRQDVTNPNQATPIIAVTAHADENFMPHWRECGINKICMKPFLEEHFLQVMEEFVLFPVAG